jgi:hypothetical protein
MISMAQRRTWQGLGSLVPKQSNARSRSVRREGDWANITHALHPDTRPFPRVQGDVLCCCFSHTFPEISSAPPGRPATAARTAL